MNPLDKQAADASDLSGGEATGEQSACPASDAAKVSPEFRADPSFTYLLTDNLVEANKEILRLRDEKAELLEALETFAIMANEDTAYLPDEHVISLTYDDSDLDEDLGGPNTLLGERFMRAFRRAAEVYARLTRQEGSEEGDRLGRLKVGAGCEQSPPPSSQEGGE